MTRRGIYKQIATAENYIDSTYSGTRCFIFNTAGSGTSSFTVRTGNCSTGSAATFSVDISVPSAATVNIEGLLQNLVGTSARVGLTFYDGSEGGNVARPIAISTLTNVINDVKNTNPSANTPLAETLWTVTGYFAQVATLEGGPARDIVLVSIRRPPTIKTLTTIQQLHLRDILPAQKALFFLLQTESHVMMTIYLQV